MKGGVLKFYKNKITFKLFHYVPLVSQVTEYTKESSYFYKYQWRFFNPKKKVVSWHTQKKKTLKQKEEEKMFQFNFYIKRNSFL